MPNLFYQGGTQYLVTNYSYPVILGYTKLDLGSGDRPKEGFLGVDLYSTMEGVYTYDLTITPWPWEDNSVDELYSDQFLEHLGPEDRIKVMNEAYRILKPGCKFEVSVPYFKSARAVQDPTHKWPPFAETSFLYFNKKWRVNNKLDHYLGITCDFEPEVYFMQDKDTGEIADLKAYLTKI